MVKRALVASLAIAVLFACSSSDSGGAAGLGPECQAYLGSDGCCREAANGVAAALKACDDAEASAANDPTAAEAACRKGNETAHAAGLCGGGSGGAGGGGGHMDPVCARFIACAYATAPSQAAGATAAYGPSGACWITETASVCHDGCASGLKGLHDMMPNASACAICVADSDCGSANPACDTVHGECVACNQDANCAAPTPACDAQAHACVGCTSDANCAAPTARCDARSNQCVACASSADCVAPELCDMTSNTCKPCNQPDSCGVCGMNCVQQLESEVGSFSADSITCTGGATCSALVYFDEGDNRACDTLCMPWTCTAENVLFGTQAQTDHEVSGVPCSSAAPATDRGAPFLEMICSCSQ